MTLGWVLLLIAGFTEIFFALSLKLNDGFTKLWPTVMTAITGLISFGCLAWAIKTIPIGTAYAIWCGIGIAGTALIGIFFYQESTHWIRLICILAIVGGIVGLKLMA